MINLLGPLNSGAGAGGAGTATNNATSTIRATGLLHGIYVRYNHSPPAGTTDVTVATAGTTMPAFNLLVLTDAATDGYFSTRANAYSAAGASQAAIWEEFAVDDFIKVTIAQANVGDSVDVWLLLEE